MKQKDLNIRFAAEQDIPLILKFIKELADYEKMLDQVVATTDLLQEWLFEKKKAEVIIGELEGKPIGFALFFPITFQPFLAVGVFIWRICM